MGSVPQSNKNKKVKFVVKTVHLPETYAECLEKLVEKGFYPSVSEAIRFAVRDMIWRERDRLLDEVKY